MANTQKVFNFFLRQPWVHEMIRSAIGMIDLPMPSSPTLHQQLSDHHTITQLEELNAAQYIRYLLIIQDPFTSYYDTKVVADFVQLMEKLGFKSVLLPFSPNGKAQHINGFLTGFASTAHHTSDILNCMAQLGMPLMGVDPALVL